MNKEVTNILLKIRTKKEMERFLEDILTPKEIKEIGQRWQIVKLLKQGVTQRKISKKLGVSISTITRGSRVLQNKQSNFYKYD